MKIERKDGLFRGDMGPTLPVEVKEVSEKGEFAGYASIFGNEDDGHDIVQAGAFAESLTKWPAEKVRMLYQHDSSEVIGKYTVMREDQKGLYCEGRLFLGVQRAREVYELMSEGAIEGLSIGYRTREYEMDRVRDVRTLIKVDLKEVSIVTFPMNELAGISLVKHDGRLPTERDFERYLTRDAGFSAQQAKAIIANGYKSLIHAERDAGEGDDKGLAQALVEAAQRMRS